MAKKTTPIITHTEILARAIRNIEDEIEQWKKRIAPVCEVQKIDLETMMKQSTADLLPKLDALKEMYRIETGAEYS